MSDLSKFAESVLRKIGNACKRGLDHVKLNPNQVRLVKELIASGYCSGNVKPVLEGGLLMKPALTEAGWDVYREGE